MSTDETIETTDTPQLKTLTQYARSIHFTNDAATNNTPVRGNPTINVKVEVSTQNAPEGRHVVALELSVEANAGEDAVFTIEIDYVGVFEVTGVPEEKMPVVLQVECPRMLFPFARRLIADMSREGGFMPLLLDPIDFLGLFMQQRKAADEGGAKLENGADVH
ncbi:MAG: protein-export chaperone SecB [Neomegalonema sp.]|nr:protein-export chaperone SecB [Neomegalonema sp.]